jgi:hypothetical protein
LSPPTTAVVITNAFPSPVGGLNTVKLSDRSTMKGIDNTLDSDSVVRAFGGKVYVLFRTKGVMRVYDPAAGFAKPVEMVTGDGTVAHDKTDPTDAYAIPGTTRVYVAMYANDAAHAIGILDVAQPAKGVIGWIALPPTTKSMKPRATVLWPCNGLVYAFLEDLDDKFALTGNGRVAVIDPAKDALVSDGKPATFGLSGTNPAGGFPYGVARFGTACDDVLVSDAGDLSGMSMDLGGIERVDLAARQSKGLLLTGADLKGNPGALAVVSSTLGYLVAGSFPNKVIAFDPTAKKVLGDVLGPADYIPFVQVSPDMQVFVGINGSSGKPGAGLYVAPADGKPITATPISFDQPPYTIAFF